MAQVPGFCQRCDTCILLQRLDEETFCAQCGWNQTTQVELDSLREKVNQFEILENHALATQILLQRDSSHVQLIVGSDKTVLFYKKVLLCYNSPMLDRAFYGPFSESTTGEISLPEEDINAVKTFGLWAETGVISLHSIYGNDITDTLDENAYVSDNDSNSNSEDDTDSIARSYGGTTLARLWILGNKLLGSRFCNLVMHMLIHGLDSFTISHATVRYIFSHTLPESKLRVLILDRIQVEGPFREQDYRGHFQKWLDLIGEGAEFVRACVAAGGFHSRNEALDPMNRDNRCKHLEDESLLPTVEDWRRGEF